MLQGGTNAGVACVLIAAAAAAAAVVGSCPLQAPLLPSPHLPQVEMTGRKWDQKLYRWHTGYPGGLKERTAKEHFARKPDAILREAVLGMLPKNNLRRVRAARGGCWAWWADGGWDAAGK